MCSRRCVNTANAQNADSSQQSQDGAKLPVAPRAAPRAARRAALSRPDRAYDKALCEVSAKSRNQHREPYTKHQYQDLPDGGRRCSVRRRRANRRRVNARILMVRRHGLLQKCAADNQKRRADDDARVHSGGAAYAKFEMLCGVHVMVFFNTKPLIQSAVLHRTAYFTCRREHPYLRAWGNAEEGACTRLRVCAHHEECTFSAAAGLT